MRGDTRWCPLGSNGRSRPRTAASRRVVGIINHDEGATRLSRVALYSDRSNSGMTLTSAWRLALSEAMASISAHRTDNHEPLDLRSNLLFWFSWLLVMAVG